MNIVLIRHGTTISNLQKTYSPEDTQLVESAYAELETTKKLLSRFSYKRVYASPLLRVRQTLDALGIKADVYDDRLKERDFGEFKGKTYKQIVEENPLATKDWFADLKDGKPPAGESSFEVFTRVSAFLNELAVTNCDSLLVCHYGTITMAMAWAIGNFESWRAFIPLNAAISEIETDGTYKIIRHFNIEA